MTTRRSSMARTGPASSAAPVRLVVTKEACFPLGVSADCTTMLRLRRRHSTHARTHANLYPRAYPRELGRVLTAFDGTRRSGTVPIS